MAFRVECTCGAKINVSEELCGLTRPCPKCSEPLFLQGDVDPGLSNISTNTENQEPSRKSDMKSKNVAILGVVVVASFFVVAILYVTSEKHNAEGNAKSATSANARIAQSQLDDSSALSQGDNSETSGDSNDQAQRSFVRPKSGTGIKESVLLPMMNANSDSKKSNHHQFSLNSLVDDEKPERVALYKDTNNELYLMLSGPPNDLMLVQLIMPLEEFVGEENGQVTGTGAAAFGRCVQRMTLAADPSWASDLYNWMNENMAHGLLMPDGITTSKRHLMAKFSTFNTDGDMSMVSMTIGIPAK